MFVTCLYFWIDAVLEICDNSIRHKVYGILYSRYDGDTTVYRESARDVYSRNIIIAIKKLAIIEWHNYKHWNGSLFNHDKKNRLMRIDELHKFSDGTLNDVRSALDDILKRSYNIESSLVPEHRFYREPVTMSYATVFRDCLPQLVTSDSEPGPELYGSRVYEAKYQMGDILRVSSYYQFPRGRWWMSCEPMLLSGRMTSATVPEPIYPETRMRTEEDVMMDEEEDEERTSVQADSNRSDYCSDPKLRCNRFPSEQMFERTLVRMTNSMSPSTTLYLLYHLLQGVIAPLLGCMAPTAHHHSLPPSSGCLTKTRHSRDRNPYHKGSH
ncbi:hypothetical protein Tco_1090635 [Tanacetum coccineum]|uniref:Uncharacterized protein n=1 Tax=Tanacetum coccineum TaxID=301880 RepID=A0ABQ5I4T2_9ASTR